MTIEEIIRTISVWSTFPTIIVGLVSIKKLTADSLKILGIVLLAGIPEAIAAFHPSSGYRPLIYNIYTIAEFIFFYQLFQKKLNTSTSKIILKLTVLLYLIASFYLIIKYGIFIRFLNEWVCINNIIYLIWIMFFLRDNYIFNKNDLDFKTPFSFYLLGIIFYASCSTIVFALFNYIKQHPNTVLQNLWIIHSFCNILMYVLFSVGFWKNYRLKTTVKVHEHYIIGN